MLECGGRILIGALLRNLKSANAVRNRHVSQVGAELAYLLGVAVERKQKRVTWPKGPLDPEAEHERRQSRRFIDSFGKLFRKDRSRLKELWHVGESLFNAERKLFCRLVNIGRKSEYVSGNSQLIDNLDN